MNGYFSYLNFLPNVSFVRNLTSIKLINVIDISFDKCVSAFNSDDFLHKSFMSNEKFYEKFSNKKEENSSSEVLDYECRSVSFDFENPFEIFGIENPLLTKRKCFCLETHHLEEDTCLKIIKPCKKCIQ
jgi:hypothetical protein